MKPAYAVAVVLYCAVLFILSSGPAPRPVDISLFEKDKLLHAAAYGLMASLVWLGMYRSGREWSRRQLWWYPILFASLYGLSDEIHQYFVPSRHFDLRDLVADVAGAVAAQAFLFVVIWRNKQPRPLPGDTT